MTIERPRSATKWLSARFLAELFLSSSLPPPLPMPVLLGLGGLVEVRAGGSVVALGPFGSASFDKDEPQLRW